ncbi:MAG: AAA family ATPase [Betaproteobacteria bacterium]|nr:AAA family ATPase [Betaproteobacteria bacterium]
MYLNHFGLDEPPFRITPHTDFFFAGANRGATLEALLYAITHDEGIVKVSGEVGSGKTMLCRVLMERLPEQVQTILLSNPALSRDEMIYAIAEELDIRQQGERLSVLLLKLQEHLITLYGENQRVVLLIDEAHAMPQETLEQVRLLSNLESSHSKLLQIVLFGQPELDEHLSMPHMRPLKERITHSFRLAPLARSDVEAYLDFRMRAAGYRGPNVFAPDAVRRIVKASEGLTRRVNILADKSLLAAFADNEHGISARHVNRAIRDSEFYHASIGKAKIGLAAGGVAAGLALGLGLHYLLSPSAQPATASAAPAQPATIGPAVPATEPSGAAVALAQQQIAQPAGTPPMTPAPSALATPAPIAATKQVAAPAAAKSTAAPVAAAQTAPAAQAAAAPAPAAAVPAATAAIELPAAPTGAKPGSMNYLPPMPAAGRLTRERFAATQEWLKSAPGDRYSIQLLTAGTRDLRHVEELLARATGRNLDLSDFYVYGVKINDQQHYRLAYGLYPTFADANQGIKALPPVYRQFAPYQRSVERMRSQNRQ